MLDETANRNARTAKREFAAEPISIG